MSQRRTKATGGIKNTIQLVLHFKEVSLVTWVDQWDHRYIEDGGRRVRPGKQYENTWPTVAVFEDKRMV